MPFGRLCRLLYHADRGVIGKAPERGAGHESDHRLVARACDLNGAGRVCDRGKKGVDAGWVAEDRGDRQPARLWVAARR